MTGRDLNSSPTQYRCWEVEDEPDFDGYYYTGYKSGESPLVDIVAYQLSPATPTIQDTPFDLKWDFNWPKAQKWSAAKKVTPHMASGSQLAVLDDGYIYLFGGESSDKILRAHQKNPSDWVDTGARLPTILSDSCFIIIDDKMYLFGGYTDQPTDKIFSANVSDPLTWIDTGAVIPKAIFKSHLTWKTTGGFPATDGYIYLIGGKDADFAVDVIYQASFSDPLTWTDTGITFPEKLYGGVVYSIGENFQFILGGCLDDDSPSNRIYINSPAFDLTHWNLHGVLPAACTLGQVVSLGEVVYLFTQAAISNPPRFETRIFRAHAPLYQWIDTQATIPGDITQSQLAMIDDRLWLFSGNGTTAIFMCEQDLKFNWSQLEDGDSFPEMNQYQLHSYFTRVSYPGGFQDSHGPYGPLGGGVTHVLGIPWWKSNYKKIVDS